MDYTIAPLSEHTGAEVRGIDLTEPIDEVARARLNRAFVDRSVLVFRDQHLTPQQLLEAVGLFGEPFPQHNSRFALPERPLVHYISNQDFYPDGKRYIPGEGYHTDHSNAACPPKATVLHAVSLPDRGGDTQYVDMRLAYDELPKQTKRRLDGLKAIHVYQSRFSARKLMKLTSESRGRVPDVVAHPIVRTHPESGRKAIYINPIRTEGIVGMPEEAALALLADLLGHATQSRYQYRHHWRPGDLVMWDNRSLLHKANGRLRYEPAAISLPHHAAGRCAGLRRSRVPIEKGEPCLTLTDAPDERAQAVIRGGLSEYNLREAGYRDARPLAVLVSDPESRETIGGLLGRTSMGLLFIDLFFLPESLRRNGIGSRVIRTAEDEALRRGCSRAILFTVTFQAPGFYERRGYQVLGRIECDPPGHTRICMTKKLGTAV